MNVVEFATGIILCINIYYLCKNTNNRPQVTINPICNSCTNKKQSTIITDCWPEEFTNHYCEAGCELITHGNTGCREYKSR